MNSQIVPANTEVSTSSKLWALSERTLAVFYGCPQTPRLSHYFLPKIFMARHQVLYLDGANQISPVFIAHFARQCQQEPCSFNSLIRVSRAFTCFQLTELIRRAPKFLEKFPAQVVMITALPDLYFDEDVREPEARTAFERALEALRHPVLQRLSVSVFSNAPSIQTSRKTFFQQLVAQADRVVRVAAQPDTTLAFTCEKAKPQLLI
jgi:hypothetical protein